MALTIKTTGDVTKLELLSGYQVTYNSDRENQVLSIPYTATTQGYDLISVGERITITGSIYPVNSNYASQAAIIAAFKSLHPSGSSISLKIVDDDSLFSHNNVIVTGFTLNAISNSPLGFTYTINITVISTQVI